VCIYAACLVLNTICGASFGPLRGYPLWWDFTWLISELSLMVITETNCSATTYHSVNEVIKGEHRERYLSI